MAANEKNSERRLELKLDRVEITDCEVVNARLHIYGGSSASDDEAGQWCWWDSDSDGPKDGPDYDTDDSDNANVFAQLFLMLD